MSRKGNFLDYAVSESFFKSLKTEELNKMGTIKEFNLNSSVFKYIKVWYKTRRVHPALNGLTL